MEQQEPKTLPVTDKAEKEVTKDEAEKEVAKDEEGSKITAKVNSETKEEEESEDVSATAKGGEGDV
jgi:hypothetical protein